MHRHVCTSVCMSGSIVSVCDLSLQKEAAEGCGSMKVVLVGLKALETTDLALLALWATVAFDVQPFSCQRICAADAVPSEKNLAEGFIHTETFSFFNLASPVCMRGQNLS